MRRLVVLCTRRILMLLSILFIGLLSVATPQNLYTVETTPPRGFMPSADQLASPVDSIDPVSGKLHVEIPLASLPRTRGGFGFDLGLVYDSHLYDIFPGLFTYSNPPQIATKYELDSLSLNGGWSYNFKNYQLEGETRQGVDPSNQCPAGEELRVYRYRIRLADGSLHVLHLKPATSNIDWNEGYKGDGFYPITASGKASACAAKWGWPAQTNGWFTYYTSDGSFLKLEINANGSNEGTQQWYLYFPDGRRVVGRGYEAEKLYDANGNVISFSNVLDAESNPETLICRRSEE